MMVLTILTTSKTSPKPVFFLHPGWWCNNHLEKYEFVNGKDDIHEMEKMFETTNQYNIL